MKYETINFLCDGKTGFEKAKKIALIDNELITRKNHSFPNLAIMKLSSYYKSKGCIVKLISFDEIDPNNMFTEQYDVIFVSKVFTDTPTPSFIDKIDNLCKGGSGFFYDLATPLHYDIEHSFPDYNLYKQIPSCTHEYYHKYSIGFITRGCIRQCKFCINRNSKQVIKHSELSEFVDKKRPYLMLLDDNITAYKGFYNVFDELNKLNIPFVFKQGMDFRLLNSKKMDVLWNSNYLSTDRKNNIKGARIYHFAFDNIDDLPLIEKRLKEYYYNKPYAFKVFFYVLTGFDRNDKYDNDFFEKDFDDLLIRIKILFKYNAYPYIMIHEDYIKSPYSEYIKKLKLIINNPMYITNKTMDEAIRQSNKPKLYNFIKNKYNWFLKLKFNSKLYSIQNSGGEKINNYYEKTSING